MIISFCTGLPLQFVRREWECTDSNSVLTVVAPSATWLCQAGLTGAEGIGTLRQRHNEMSGAPPRMPFIYK
eukprot:3289180-Amphidinium_carterae.1